MAKKITTIICCIAFTIGGYFISSMNNANLTINNAKTATAAPLPQAVIQYPKDLLLGHTNDVGLITVRDTIRDTIPLEIRHDTITKTKYVTKWKTKIEYVRDTCFIEQPMDTLCDSSHMCNVVDTVPKIQPIDTVYVTKPTLVIPILESNDSTTVSL